MPLNHAEDCQCSVCKRVRTKAGEALVEPVIGGPVEEPEQVPVVAGVTLGSLPIGTNFRLKSRILKKLNNHGGSCVVLDSGTTNEAFQLPGSTVIELLPRLPDRSQEMDA